ncbi:MAG: molybdopterin-dependent oxidoreductase [Actinomycetota bacterium]
MKSDSAVETRRSFCRFCHAGCAIDVDVDVDANRVVAVRGVLDDPMYEGYTCIKGRHLGDQHHHDARLYNSVKKIDGSFVSISTSTAFDQIAQRLAGLIERHGPRTLATYCGTAAFQNAAGLPVAKAFHRAIGSPSFYTSVSIDQPAKYVAPMRHGSWQAGVQPFESSAVAMVIGCNTLVSAYSFPGGLPSFNPLVRLRRAKANGLRLIVIDPRYTELAQYADLFLQVRPGEDPTLLAGIIREILANDAIDREFVSQWVNGLAELARAVEPFTPDYVAHRAGVPADQVREAARVFATGPTGSVSTGTGPNMAPHSTLTEHLSLCLNTLCGRYVRAGEALLNPGGVLTASAPIRAQVNPPMPQALHRGAPQRVRDLYIHHGEAPTSTLADEMLLEGEGQVRALLTIGGNPVVAWPDQRKTVEALRSLDLHVVIDAQISATAQLAHYVIASTLSLERPDLPTSIDPWFGEAYTNYTPAVIEPAPEMRQEWQLYTELAARLGVTLSLPGGDIAPGAAATADDILDLIYVRSKVPLSELREQHGGRMYPELATVAQPAEASAAARLELAPEGIERELADVLAEQTSAEVIAGFDATRHTFRLTSRRLKSVFNSSGRELPALRDKEGTNFAHMHPDDLVAIGVAGGDTVELASPRGAIRAIVKSAPDVRQGTVSMAHAWGGLPDTESDVAVFGSTTSMLVDTASGYDPFTGIPVMSAIPVQVRAVRG